jgi:hypothetical protein
MPPAAVADALPHPLLLLLQTKLGKSNAICSTGMLFNERSQVCRAVLHHHHL